MKPSTRTRGQAADKMGESLREAEVQVFADTSTHR